MKPIKEILSRIIYSQNPKDFSLFYLDRKENALKEIKFQEIAKVEEGLILKKDGSYLPLHRIKLVKEKDKIIWQRGF